ncbi:MAG: DNA polymerase III subunit delta [Paludibacteraceae bacterium]|nr:DNA polymerase III subunit delta [Paludibacteraceae bacterium]
MVKKYDDIMRALRAGEYAPIYILCGEEPYYMDRVFEFIAENALDEMAREFDQQVVYGRDLQGADISPIIGAARGFAMMGGRKVVMVREAQAIKKWDALAAYLENMMPQTVLVICYNGKPDKRQGIWKKASEHPQVVWLQSDKLRDYEVEKWILGYIQEYNQQLAVSGEAIKVDPKVAPLLADHLGNDLSAVVSALQKLIDGRPEGVNTIDAALVERNIGISKDYNIMELQAALIRGDIFKANQITRYFASSKDHPMIRELAPLFTFFSNLLMYHYMPDKSQANVARELGINPYFVKDYVTAAKRYPAGKVFLIIGYLRDTDARLKGVNNPSAKDADLWKELIYKIMH